MASFKTQLAAVVRGPQTLDDCISNFNQDLQSLQSFYGAKDTKLLDSYVSDLNQKLLSISRDLGRAEKIIPEIKVVHVIDNKDFSYASEFKNTVGDPRV
jgi:hypothetical protein